MFRDRMLARIIEPTSELESLRVPEEVKVSTATSGSPIRRIRGKARQSLDGNWPRRGRRVPGSVRASLVLYDVSVLYYETDKSTAPSARIR